MIKKIFQKLNKLLSIINLELIKTQPKEAIKFAKEYFKNEKIVAAEIGVFFGETSKEINKNLNVKKLYLIDPYEKYKDYCVTGDYLKHKKAKKNAHKRNPSKNNIWIEKFSEEAVKLIKENLDFLYIDGNHEYEYVKKDLELYWPKIKKGGIISGHDIQYPGVSKALLDFANKRKLEISFGDRRDWWIIKK